MKTTRKKILCTLFLYGVSLLSGWGMLTYENGLVWEINTPAVIWWLFSVLTFFTAASLLHNAVFLLPLSLAAGIFMFLKNDFGFLLLPLSLLPCLFYSSLKDDKKNRILFYIGAVINTAALSVCIKNIVSGFLNIKNGSIFTPAQLSSTGIATKCILALFVPLSAYCLYKSFSFTAPEKASRKKSNAKAAERKTKLSERYNTFYLFVTVNALLTALYTVLFVNKYFSAAMTVTWGAFELFLYFGEDPTLCSISATLTKERSPSDAV